MEANMRLAYGSKEGTSVSGMHWVELERLPPLPELVGFLCSNSFCSVCRRSQRPNFRYQLKQDTTTGLPPFQEQTSRWNISGFWAPVMIMGDGVNGGWTQGLHAGGMQSRVAVGM